VFALKYRFSAQRLAVAEARGQILCRYGNDCMKVGCHFRHSPPAPSRLSQSPPDNVVSKHVRDTQPAIESNWRPDIWIPASDQNRASQGGILNRHNYNSHAKGGTFIMHPDANLTSETETPPTRVAATRSGNWHPGRRNSGMCSDSIRGIIT
jgi:hypothetical protein